MELWQGLTFENRLQGKEKEEQGGKYYEDEFEKFFSGR